jgi:hypothetical protein
VRRSSEEERTSFQYSRHPVFVAEMGTLGIMQTPIAGPSLPALLAGQKYLFLPGIRAFVNLGKQCRK